MSFRSTTSATEFTKRGFKIAVDRDQGELRFILESSKANQTDPKIASWLRSVEGRVGLGQLNPEPYWGFEDLRYQIGSKIKNCFYVVADSKVDNKKEYFLYKNLYILSGFSFEKFINCVEEGTILIDFDARTGHNHGTKFRIRQGRWASIYSNVEHVI